MRRLRIAIVVHGRFHAFDLARELLRLGHDVTVFTNYPGWAVERFGVPPERVRTAWVHGAISRVLPRVPGANPPRHEAALHRAFGRWAARSLAGEPWDVIHAWSGIAEELLTDPRVGARCTILMRGSAHVDAQDAILREEEQRAGTPLDRPSPWMVARERREYVLADRVMVLSTFAQTTFTARGFAASRLDVLPLGVDVGAFRPSPDVLDARRRRIGSGAPLRVLYAGALSLQKGLLDLAAVARRCEGQPIEFQLAGPDMEETRALVNSLGANVVRLGKLSGASLPEAYWAADVFYFPTLQDGFGMVLMQARAAGLPILCTPHSAGPDIVRPGIDGWIVPIRDPGGAAERLLWAESHREALIAMADAACSTGSLRDWSAVAHDFERLAMAALASGALQERPA